jgi:cytochrome c peroxidase
MPKLPHRHLRRLAPCLRASVLLLGLLLLRALAPHDPPRESQAAMATLGAALFSDTRLSGAGTTACATCHRPDRAYADGLPLAVGATGERGTRNTPTLLHTAELAAYTWDDPQATSLQAPIARALSRVQPVEMGAGGSEGAILARLRADATRARQFREAFPADGEPVTWEHLVEALAAFVRTLGGTSPYDRYVAGDTGALSAQQIQGMRLFAEVGCRACHSGARFTNGSYHNLGLYRDEALPGQAGLAAHTGDPADAGRFRVPSLRNVARTAPYFHDGSAATLDAVLSVYAQGGRVVSAGPGAGDGRANPHKSGALAPLQLTPSDRAALIAFLGALSDAP